MIAARAATIDERGEAAGRLRPLDLPPGTLRLWQQAFSPGDPDAFIRRLAWDGFDRAAFVERAGADASSDASVPSGDPAWIDWLDRVLDEAASVRADVRAGAFMRSDAPDAPAFEDVWTTMRRAGRRAVVSAAPAPAIARLSADALDALDRQLLLDAGRFGDLALYERFRALVPPAADPPAAGSAPPAAPDAHYRAFVDDMLDGGLVAFFADHAALARQLSTLLSTWVEATIELLRRLDADVERLAATFGAGTPPGRVVSIVPALSDPHHGRRRVLAMAFESGLRLVYKPRSVRLDGVFADLVHGLNRGLTHPLATLRTLDRGSYGWVEMAACEPLADRVEGAAWFHRAGALLCITSVLGARDLHRENVVATRRGPVIVDLELLLQPGGRPATRPIDDGEPRHGSIGDWSCLATGLLTLIDLTPDGEPHDAGGLRGEQSGALPFPRRAWQHRGTDALRVVDEATFTTSAAHLVMVDGLAERPEDWAAEIVDGFDEAYRHMIDRRDEIAAGPLRDFASCRLRVLPRPTNQYAMLAWLLATPRYQREGAAACCAIDVLHRAFNREIDRPALWPVAVAERRAIGGLDVPYFSVPAAGTDVSCEGEVVATGYFVRSGLDAAGDRLAALSEADLAAQTTLLKRALSESVRSQYAAPLDWAGDGDVDAAAGAFEREATAHAVWIARELRARAVRTADGLLWPYRGRTGGPGWRDHHLYDGTMGPAVFFAALGSITGDAQWAEAADGALASIHAHARAFPIDVLPGDEPVGAGNGLGSVVYGLSVTSVLLRRADDLALARDLARAMAARATASTDSDVVDGLAGALLALLVLHEVGGDDGVLAVAKTVGEALIARGEETAGGLAWRSRDGTRLLGFAHGVAGVAVALTRLASATGEPRYGLAARRALRLLRRGHLQVSGNWPIAVGDSRASGGVMMGWCHGAPGISLAALAAAGFRPSPPVIRSMRSALLSVGNWQPAQSDHVCCGLLARAEALLAAGVATGDHDLVEAARALARRVMARARRRGHFRLSGAGTDYRVFDPGFFQGMSGIGYALLRLAHPAALPSIPAFDAPRSSLRYCSPVADHRAGRSAGEAGGRATRPVDSVSAEFTS